MKNVATLVLALIFGCSSRNVSVLPVNPPALPAPASMALIGRFGIAHACPVKGTILTAAHVGITVGRDMTQHFLSYQYSQNEKRGGVSTVNFTNSRDLAMLRVDLGDEPESHDLSYMPPTRGEDVFWQEFNLGKNALREDTRRGKILEINTGHFTFSPAPAPGSSGGCVFNSSGRVIGILIWTIGRPGAGVGIDITGEYWPVAE